MESVNTEFHAYARLSCTNPMGQNNSKHKIYAYRHHEIGPRSTGVRCSHDMKQLCVENGLYVVYFGPGTCSVHTCHEMELLLNRLYRLITTLVQRTFSY